MFDLFGFAATDPSSKQRPAVASDKYRVSLLMHICGARLKVPQRIENSILGRHPPVPGSLNSDVLIPTQIETIGFLICKGDEDLPEAIDSATGIDTSVLAAAFRPLETRPSIRSDENATATTATMRSRVRETFRSV